MPKARPLYRITDVQPEQGFELRMAWEDGYTALVDLTRTLHTFKVFSRHRENPELFRSVHVADDGWSIEWADGMDLGTDELRRLALEQAGESMSPGAFRAWMERHGLTDRKAADMLGISRRMVTYYKSGEQIIPKYILLACRGAFPEDGGLQPEQLRALQEIAKVMDDFERITGMQAEHYREALRATPHDVKAVCQACDKDFMRLREATQEALSRESQIASIRDNWAKAG